MVTSIVIAVFCLLFALIMLVVSSGLRYFEAEHKRKVEKTLGGTSATRTSAKRTSLLTQGGSLDKAGSNLRERPFYMFLTERIEQAGLNWSVWRLIGLMVLGAGIGFFLGSRFTIPVYREAFAIGLTLLLGYLPYFYVTRKRAARLSAFEEQFPEALDFMARALRAGHAFSVSLEMLGQESAEPLATEFRQVYHTQNLGSSLEDSLRDLSRRVPLIDVRFFVSAVLTQRQTGGNLAAILENLAFVIRERFRLKGHIRAASAHGRVTAGVLTVLPIVTVLALMVVAPDYLMKLAEDEDGRWLVIGAMLAQILGYYCMRRIVNIRI